MAGRAAEQALTRVLAYLEGAGLGVDARRTQAALRLIEQTLEEHPEDLVARVMAALPAHFILSSSPLPPATPRLKRSSIRYAPYL